MAHLTMLEDGGRQEGNSAGDGFAPLVGKEPGNSGPVMIVKLLLQLNTHSQKT